MAVLKQKAIINAAAGGLSFAIFGMITQYFIGKDFSVPASLVGGASWFIGSLIFSSLRKAK
ncbi:hypothetical protein [Paenibacillus elgii]|uniref:hypothetical protein n=1 Tax=Paenibacillus elgii TaxID=189691 RepID=UPI001112044E|nr:hypothetical protein [Paenibacillus elgii]